MGCTDPTACNFSPNAIFDSGFCNFSCYGCTDFNATNFTPTASIDDGTCIYCAAGELILEVRMTDAFGDGWNGAVYYISELDGDIAATGDARSGRPRGSADQRERTWSAWLLVATSSTSRQETIPMTSDGTSRTWPATSTAPAPMR